MFGFQTVPKSKQNGSDFRQCLKSKLFGNGTIMQMSEIRTFGFQTFTVRSILKNHPIGLATLIKMKNCFSFAELNFNLLDILGNKFQNVITLLDFFSREKFFKVVGKLSLAKARVVVIYGLTSSVDSNVNKVQQLGGDDL